MSENFEKFKYGTATDINATYAVIGNPSSFYLHNTYVGTGSVYVYKYSSEYDSYQYLKNIKKTYSFNDNSILAVDTSSAIETFLNADTSSNANGLNLLIDFDSASIIKLSDGFGTSVSLSGSILAIGCPYFYYKNFPTSAILTGSATIELYNLSSITSSASVASPSYVIYNSSSYEVNNTFGESISLAGNVLVVGSSLSSNTSGAFYIYTQSLSNTWDLYQSFSGSAAGHRYGGSVKIDPSGSKRIAVGNFSTSSFGVDVYTYNSSTGFWAKSETVFEDRTLTGSLNNVDFPPYIENVTSASGYGRSVALYGDFLMVGSPSDMYYREYEGASTLRNRGAVYFYHKCNDATDYYLIEKSFGDADLQKTNNFGYCVDMTNTYAVASSVLDITTYSSSYIANTIDDVFNSTNLIIGQFQIYNTSSLLDPQWDMFDLVTKKKKINYPHSTFGQSISITNDDIIVGSPVNLHDPENITGSLSSSVFGLSYIYDIKNLMRNYQVGNVFYRNGKLILSNSGSDFDNLLKDRINSQAPKFDINYQSQVTLYEKQIVCRVEPGEFNYSTNPTALIRNTFNFDIDNNQQFSFIDLDLIFRYISNTLNADQEWFNYFTFDEGEYDWFLYYYSNYNLTNVPSTYLASYTTKLESVYDLFDIDGNNKISFSDMYLMWKYFINKLDKNTVFKFVDTKSTRKTLESIISYLDTQVGKNGYGKIVPEFFNFQYSSSLDKTGSYLAPYVTSIGLYSGTELVAIAKLGTPIKNSGELPLNILVKWDI
jgi:hypothetical protein